MKRIDYLEGARNLNALITRMCELRFKYSLGEAPLWDLIIAFQYFSETGKDISVTMLTKLRYHSSKNYRTVYDRSKLLERKGLIRYTNQRIALSDLGLLEMKSLISVEPAVLLSLRAKNKKAA
jgi:hypothetical protein